MKSKVVEEKPKRKRRKAEDKPHYVNARDFEDALIQYYKDDKITNYLGESIQKIANGLSYAPNFINYCVDAETEALTQRGWLKYSEITKEDIILSYDIRKKRLAWSKILDIYKGNYKGKMHKLTIKSLDALVTPNHKFVTEENGLQPVEMIRAKDHLILMGKHVKSEKSVYDDAFVELVGWAVTEGHYALGKKTHSITVFQKIGPKADRIQECLNKLGITYKTYNWSSPNILGFCFNKEYANEIVRLAPKKVLSMEFILNLTQEQRLLLIQTMVDGDGSTVYRDHGKNSRSYVQKCEQHMDRFLIVCTMAGITASKIFCKHNSKFGYSEYFISNIYNKPKFTCRFENVDMNGGRSQAGGVMKGNSLNIGKKGKPNNPTVDYDGIVWCPTTEYGTFVCRRNGKIYVTGNSFKEDMVGDAVLKMYQAVLHKKFKLNKGFSPFGYFTTIAYHAFICRIKKEKKHHQVVEEYKERYFDTMMNEGEDCPSHRVYTKPASIDIQG